LMVVVCMCNGLNFDYDSYCQFINDLKATPQYTKATTLQQVNDYVINNLKSIPAENWSQWNITDTIINAVFQRLTNFECKETVGTPFPTQPYMSEIDGAAVAPKSHIPVFYNEHVSVTHWNLGAGYWEPYHVHSLASMTFLITHAKRDYYGPDGKVVPPKVVLGNAAADQGLSINMQEPEWLHSIRNTDTHDYHVIRVFFRAEEGYSYAPIEYVKQAELLKMATDDGWKLWATLSYEDFGDGLAFWYKVSSALFFNKEFSNPSDAWFKFVVDSSKDVAQYVDDTYRNQVPFDIAGVKTSYEHFISILTGNVIKDKYAAGLQVEAVYQLGFNIGQLYGLLKRYNIDCCASIMDLN